jgi:hypothetical protein
MKDKLPRKEICLDENIKLDSIIIPNQLGIKKEYENFMEQRGCSVYWVEQGVTLRGYCKKR